MEGPATEHEATAGLAHANQALVRDAPGEDKLFVSLMLGGKQQNLNRPKDEPLEKALGRLRAKAAPKPSGKEKRRRTPKEQQPQDGGENGDAGSGMEVVLFADHDATVPVDPATPNSQAWAQGRWLKVGPLTFAVQYNPPVVDKVTLVKRALVGHALLAYPQLLFADESATTYRWFRRAPGSDAWQDVGCTSPLYCPTEQDLGSMLRAEVTPGRYSQGETTGPTSHNGHATLSSHAQRDIQQGEPALVETGPVEAGPERWSGAARVAQGPLPLTQHPDLRVVSYNILADQYAGSTYAQEVLFNYCPVPYLDPEYRKQLVVSELLQYNADIICLQEVDQGTFNEHLVPHMALRGYGGCYTNKMGKVREGEATFWRLSRYRRASGHDILLREVLKEPLSPMHSQLVPVLQASPELRSALQKVTTIAQVTMLKPLSNNAGGPPLCIVNTHLFYHPYAPHIRTLHTAAILEEACALMQALHKDRLQQANDDKVEVQEPVLLFCGDLNSDLNDGIPGVVQLLQSGKLHADYWDWHQGATFKWGMEEEEGSPEQQAAAPKPPGSNISTDTAPTTTAKVDGASVAGSADGVAQAATPMPQEDSAAAAEAAQASLPLVVGVDLELPCGPLRSADDLATPYTNYTSGYKALLDYVWFPASRVKVLSNVPVPSVEELNGFVPSQRYPSDHLAVVYDLRLEQQ